MQNLLRLCDSKSILLVYELTKHLYKTMIFLNIYRMLQNGKKGFVVFNLDLSQKAYKKITCPLLV